MKYFASAIMLGIAVIEPREIWDRFIDKEQPNTFLHSWDWGEFNEQMGEQVWRLGIFDTSALQPDSTATLIGIALIIKITARRGAFLFCPHGPLLSGIMNYEIGIKVLVKYLKVLAKQEHCGFIRFSPLLLKTPKHEKLWQELGLRKAPIHMHPELAWVLDITPSEEALLHGMRKTTRYSIRKAEKDGVEVMMSTNPEDIEKFWSVYSATVDRQHFVPFSKQYLRTEFEIFAQQGSAALFFGTYRGEIISTVFTVFQPWSAFYHHGASIPKYSNLPASQLVQWRAILEAKRRGCARYNFWGIAPENALRHPWQGLTVFKKGFGGYAEEYVPAQDFIVALPSYLLTYTIEKIRKFKRGL